jgi:hypothetical protein
MRRRERKFGRNERREKNSEQISVVWVGSEVLKIGFLNFTKYTVAFQK